MFRSVRTDLLNVSRIQHVKLTYFCLQIQLGIQLHPSTQLMISARIKLQNYIIRKCIIDRTSSIIIANIIDYIGAIFLQINVNKRQSNCVFFLMRERERKMEKFLIFL